MYDENSDYVINDLNGLENSSNEIKSLKEKLAEDSSNLRQELKKMQENWQNEDGADIASAVENITGVINSIDEEILPTLTNYTGTIDQIVTETRSNQSTTM